MLFLGIHRPGVQHDRAAQPVQAIALLLSPAQRSTQDYLAQLATIARYFSHVKSIDDLIARQSVEQLQDWFGQRQAVGKQFKLDKI